MCCCSRSEMDSGWAVAVLFCCCLSAVQAQVPNLVFEDQDWSPDTDGAPSQSQLDLQLRRLAARVERLESECNGQPKVAFSASLVREAVYSYYGPYDGDTTLIFRKVTTNIGNAYNATTGVFTAPQRGVYYIRFTGCVGNSGLLNAALLKNGENMFAIYETVGYHSGGSNGMPLLLEEGDRVWVVLWSQQSIFDQSRLSTFSGFLIFPM